MNEVKRNFWVAVILTMIFVGQSTLYIVQQDTFPVMTNDIFHALKSSWFWCHTLAWGLLFFIPLLWANAESLKAQPSNWRVILIWSLFSGAGTMGTATCSASLFFSMYLDGWNTAQTTSQSVNVIGNASMYLMLWFSSLWLCYFGAKVREDIEKCST